MLFLVCLIVLSFHKTLPSQAEPFRATVRHQLESLHARQTSEISSGRYSHSTDERDVEARHAGIGGGVKGLLPNLVLKDVRMSQYDPLTIPSPSRILSR